MQKPAPALKPTVTKLPPPAPTPARPTPSWTHSWSTPRWSSSPATKPTRNPQEGPVAPAAPTLDVDQAASDPPVPSVRMVNSKRVTLNFELKDVGASGVSGVELWVTQAGQDANAWKKGEIVAQTNHSFTVEVKEEGLYGFTLLARNGSGVGKEDAPSRPTSSRRCG